MYTRAFVRMCVREWSSDMYVTCPRISCALGYRGCSLTMMLVLLGLPAILAVARTYGSFPFSVFQVVCLLISALRQLPRSIWHCVISTALPGLSNYTERSSRCARAANGKGRSYTQPLSSWVCYGQNYVHTWHAHAPALAHQHYLVLPLRLHASGLLAAIGQNICRPIDNTDTDGDLVLSTNVPNQLMILTAGHLQLDTRTPATRCSPVAPMVCVANHRWWR